MVELSKNTEVKELPDKVTKKAVLYEYEKESVGEQDGVVNIYVDDANNYIIDSQVGIYTVHQTYQSVDVRLYFELSNQLTLTYGVTTTELETITEEYKLWLASELESFFCGEESFVSSDDVECIEQHKFNLVFSSKLKEKFIEFIGDVSPHSLEKIDTTTLYEQLPDTCIVSVDYVNSTHPEFDQ